jgi:thiamine pyrophosphate-dependent acetolactate synthase large subunit-like protein
MRRIDALRASRETIGEDFVVTSLGGNARDWFSLRSHSSFCVHHAMGLGAAVGLGLAKAVPSEPVWAFEADGGLLMNLGFLGVLGKLDQANLRLVVFDNETYLSGGGLDTLTAETVDLAAVATACGLRRVTEVREVDEFAAAMTSAAAVSGTSVIVAKVDRSVEGPPLTAEYVEMKQRFVRDAERKLGVAILRPAEAVAAPDLT